jgi:hypothetical protein
MPAEPKEPWGKYATNSVSALALIPVTLVLSFVVGSILVGDPNVPGGPEGWDAEWRVVLIWLLFASPAIIGLWFARRGMKAGERGSKKALVVNGVALALMTMISLVPGSVEAFS